MIPKPKNYLNLETQIAERKKQRITQNYGSIIGFNKKKNADEI